MNETTKKALGKEFSNLSEMLKTNTTLQKNMEEMNRALAIVPKISTPSFSLPEFRMPRIPTQEEVNEYQSASVLMQVLADEALQWKEQLPENYNPAIIAILYGGIQIHVQALSQVSFHGIRIEGTMNGSPCSLLAHQSTVQLLCYAEEVKSDVPRNPIGFIWNNKRVEV